MQPNKQLFCSKWDVLLVFSLLSLIGIWTWVIDVEAITSFLRHGGFRRGSTKKLDLLIDVSYENLLLQGSDSFPSVAIVVESLSPELESRNRIRKTWGQWSKLYSVKTFFFITMFKDEENHSKRLFEESAANNDMIVSTSSNNEFSPTFRIWQWCNNAFLIRQSRSAPPIFIVRVKSFVFINVPRLMKTLESNATQSLKVSTNETESQSILHHRPLIIVSSNTIDKILSSSSLSPPFEPPVISPSNLMGIGSLLKSMENTTIIAFLLPAEDEELWERTYKSFDDLGSYLPFFKF